MEAKPFYLPWEGHNYKTSSPKLLILGESHYKREGSDRTTFTQEVIRSWAVGEQGTRRFFTIIAKVLSDNLNTYMSKTEKADFWNKVAFYNYVQEVVGDEPGDRPTDVMWQQAQQPLSQVIQSLLPDIVIVLGGELSYHMQQVENQFPATLFCHWYHPSSFGKFKKPEAKAAFDAKMQEWLMRKQS